MVTVDPISRPPRPVRPVFWLRWRQLLYRLAVVKFRLIGGRRGIVPGAVIVQTTVDPHTQDPPAIYRYAVQLATRARLVRSERPVGTPSQRNPYQIYQLQCHKGAEHVLCGTLRRIFDVPGAKPSVDASEILVSRLPRTVPESMAGTGTGPFTLAAPFGSGLARVRAEPDECAAEGVTVAVIDEGIEAQLLSQLPGAQLISPLDVPQGPYDAPLTPKQGMPLHGTAVIATIRAVAPAATIVWQPLPDDREFWLPRVLHRISQLPEPVVLNLSWSYTVERLGGADAFEQVLRGLLSTLSVEGIVAVAATGNVRSDSPVSPMAFPARSPDVIAVGALAPDGRRAAGSRYGGKPAGIWLMAPGGAFSRHGIDDPLLRVNTTPFAGTSFATAFASALLARLFRAPDGEMRSASQIRDMVAGLAETSGVVEYKAAESGLGLLRLPLPLPEPNPPK